MAAMTFFKDMYFLLKWVYVETIPGGETLPNGAISKLYQHFGSENHIWLNDYLDCYLNEDDCKLCDTLLNEGFKLWIKCIHDPELRSDCAEEIYSQSCFLLIKCPHKSDVKYLKEALLPSPYNFITLDLFPWPQSGYYE